MAIDEPAIRPSGESTIESGAAGAEEDIRGGAPLPVGMPRILHRIRY